MNERGEVRQFHITCEASEQRLRCATACGGSGGKGTGQGESGSANQVPDTEPVRPATCAGTDTAGGAKTLSNTCASLPKAGAQCGSSARWDLCGGRRVTGVPTAIIINSRWLGDYVVSIPDLKSVICCDTLRI